jgi:hypothetical protein
LKSSKNRLRVRMRLALVGTETAHDTGACSQAVLITCLHLSHLTTLRDVGLYAWTLPLMKDHAESTMRIMKRESGITGRIRSLG